MKQPSGKGLEAEKKRLRKATKEFESFFMYQMMKTMRQTTLAPDKEKNAGPISGDLGKDEFTDMFDMELTKNMATGGRNSISDMLYRSLVKKLEGEHFDPGKQVNLKPLHPDSKQPEILLGPKKIPLKPHQVLKPILRSETFMPINTQKPKINPDPIGNQFGTIIADTARKTGLDASLIKSVINAESGGNPHAISPKGAKGLMQLADSTASDMGMSDVFDPKENISAGSRYLRSLIDRFGNVTLGLAAYNAGPANVEKYGGVPPFEETKQYIERVMAGVKGK